MSLFSKKIPKACPKCGKADGWCALPETVQQDYVNQAGAVNPFSPAPIRGSFGQNLTGTMRRKSKKTRFRCDHCGYERTY